MKDFDSNIHAIKPTSTDAGNWVSHADDEIDLFELLETLWSYRYPILLSLVFCLLTSFVYLLWAPKVFKAESVVMPLNKHQLQESRLFSKPMQSLNSKVTGTGNSVLVSSELNMELLERFHIAFSSQHNKLSFFIQENLFELYPVSGPVNKEGLAEAKERVFADIFSRNMVIDKPGKKDPLKTAYKTSFSFASKAQAESLLKKYTSFVIDRTATQFRRELETRVSEETLRLRQDIAQRKKVASTRTQDKLIVLQEAIEIARELGMKKPQFLELSANMPLYYRGYAALESERNALKARASEEPYIEGLRVLEERLAHYEGISVRDFSSVKVSQEAYSSETPVSPKPMLVLALGGILGLFMGVLIALTHHAYNARSNEKRIRQTATSPNDPMTKTGAVEKIA